MVCDVHFASMRKENQVQITSHNILPTIFLIKKSLASLPLSYFSNNFLKLKIFGFTAAFTPSPSTVFLFLHPTFPSSHPSSLRREKTEWGQSCSFKNTENSGEFNDLVSSQKKGKKKCVSWGCEVNVFVTVFVCRRVCMGSNDVGVVSYSLWESFDFI